MSNDTIQALAELVAPATAKRTYATCESGGGRYRVVLGFASLADAQAAHLEIISAPQPQAAPAPEPVAALMRSRHITTHAKDAVDMADHFSEWGDWLPTTYRHAKAVTDPSRNSDPVLYEMQPLYASTPSTQPPAVVEAGALTDKRIKHLWHKACRTVTAQGGGNEVLVFADYLARELRGIAHKAAQP